VHVTNFDKGRFELKQNSLTLQDFREENKSNVNVNVKENEKEKDVVKKLKNENMSASLFSQGY